MKRTAYLFTALSILALAAALIGCKTPQAQPTQESEKLNVTVSILPEQYFVERIGGDLVNVNVMVGPGEEPHTYEPQPDQMEGLATSKLYFSIGVEFEDAWLPKFEETNPELKIVDVSDTIVKIPMTVSDGDEKAGELDPHVWLSPANVRVIAQNIEVALSEESPANSTTYQANLESFLSDIDELDNEISSSLSSLTTRKFITFHPAWGYFARDYNLEQIAIEVGGNEPSAAELANLISTATENNIQVIFAEPEFSTKTAETIASEINGKVILIDPLAEDWLNNMKEIAQSLSGVLK